MREPRRVRAPDASWAQVRASLWFWPVVAGAVSCGVTLLLLLVRPDPRGRLAAWTWPADSSTTATMLSAVATSVITAAGLTFSLTVVALQLASQQFSPRLLRSFARDRLVQAAMAVLLAAFVSALTALRGLDPDRHLPVLAALLAQVLGLLGAVVLVVFVGHLVRRLRVDGMMAAVHRDAVRVIEHSYAPARDVAEAGRSVDLPEPAGGLLLPAWRSGFVRKVLPGPLVDAARDQGVVLVLRVRPGDSVVLGTPLASVVAARGRPLDADRLDRAALEGALRDAVALGFERTEEQDPAFGVRQLVDIAVKAVSPAINDPTTAVESLGYCADLLVRLTGRRLGPVGVEDASGAVRLVLAGRDLRYFLDLSCAQVRRFAQDEPSVLAALLRLLRDVAVHVQDDAQRDELRRQVRLVLAQTSDRLLGDDAATVHDAARQVELALTGDVDGAYRDRAGETRSV